MLKSERWKLHITKFGHAMDRFGDRKRRWVVHYIPFSQVAEFGLPEHAELFVKAMEEKHGHA